MNRHRTRFISHSEVVAVLPSRDRLSKPESGFIRCVLGAGIVAFSLFGGGMCLKAEIVEGQGDVLWTEDFKTGENDCTGEKGWNLREQDGTPKINVTRVDGKVRLSQASEKEGYNATGRYVPLFPSRVVGDSIYAQVKVTEVSDKTMMWSVLRPAPETGTIVPGQHPGIWTIPYLYVPKGVKQRELFRIYVYGPPSGYVELEWVRLVCGLPKGTVAWKREGKPAWNEGLRSAEKVTIVANLGPQRNPPLLSFYRVSYNRFQALGAEEVELRDDGKEGDEKANDGIWSVATSVPPLESIVLDDKRPQRVIVARVRYGEEEDAYGFSPWPVPAK